MKTTMNMSGYEVEREVPQAEYGDEVMCAEWNPQLELINVESMVNRNVILPANLTHIDPAVFLRKMYRNQR
jgi:hypothetical protein